MIGGGTETVSWALSVATYHLLTKPDVLARLTSELKTVVDDPLRLPSWTVFEKLPYAGAVVSEALRLSYGVSSRTARVPVEEAIVWRGRWRRRGGPNRSSNSSSKSNEKECEGGVELEYVIPRGYAIGMSAAIMHHDESIFPDSHAFLPERWLEADGVTRRRDLDKGFMAFGKGSRACVGMK